MYLGNCITVASDGTIGESFYQKEPFSASNIISVLEPLKGTPLNESIAIFLCTAIKSYSKKYNWGHKYSVNRVRETILKLPQTQEGKPDWEYMENFIREREKEVKEKIRILKGESK